MYYVEVLGSSGVMLDVTGGQRASGELGKDSNEAGRGRANYNISHAAQDQPTRVYVYYTYLGPCHKVHVHKATAKMRLTTDLINNSLSFINCLTERELELRGHKISAIENMGAAKDNDAIDLTDNDIAQLGNFPLQRRLRTLFLAQNRIANIQPNLASSIPNLRTLVLTKNKMAELADLDPLGGFKNLVYLTLMGNPVTSKEYYRYWVIWRCPSVRFLDFTKVRDVERKKAQELFGTADEPTELATQISSNKSKGFVVPTFASTDDSGKERIYTDDEKKRMRAAILNASSLAEMARLEKDFAEGRIPAHVLEGGKPMET
ncbi:U2 small nuclear ribonucleo A [Pyrenophora seminiperda CCB06]|uniref:U2 small nuclear ribonucleoprotein A' n=1 Tax=Pyrenophora seminiperda CCB06 TaxID=1302712 RepID=A0A3M7MDU7_9PLEO|nr:U2 small nuclear ribonucleo A [Pyrenophora seminiperda CCB06]